MSLGEQILGWSAAAVLVGGAVRFLCVHDKIAQQTKGMPRPFSNDPKLTEATRQLGAKMEAMSLKRPSSPPQP